MRKSAKNPALMSRPVRERRCNAVMWEKRKKKDAREMIQVTEWHAVVGAGVPSVEFFGGYDFVVKSSPVVEGV
jgi:hypothetical protein